MKNSSDIILALVRITNLPQAFQKWSSYIERSPLRRLAHNALLAASTSLIGKGLSFVKELLVAALFGLSGSLDIYLVAFVLISFPLSILLNPVQTALISELASENCTISERGRLFTATALVALAVIAVLFPIWIILLPKILPWFASGFTLSKQRGLEDAVLSLMPYYFLNGMNVLGYGVMQARGRFLVNGLLPTMMPIITICLLLLYGIKDDWHILTSALVLGSAIECIGLTIILYRGGHIGIPRRQEADRLISVLKASLALWPGFLILSVGSVIEPSIAASLGEGTNAALSYGFKLPTALQGILVTSIGITVLPYFASQLGQNRPGYCLHSLIKLGRLLLAVGMIIAISLAFWSTEIVTLFYQRGTFDALATSRVAPIQLAYFAQLPFALVSILGLKAMVALGRNRLVNLYTLISVSLQSVLAVGLGLHYGAVGIAWAATSSSMALAASSFFTARTVLHRLSR